MLKASEWIAFAAVLVAAISLISSLLGRRGERARDDARLHAQQKREDQMRADQQQREDQIHAAQLQREDALRAIRGEDAPHIEFDLDCRIHGTEGERYLVEFILVARNRGLVQWKFKSILLRVRGIEKNRPLEEWQGEEPRLRFPIVVFDDAQVIPRNLNFVFVDPGVSQTINYVTTIPISIKYILAHVEFHYDKFTPHSAEKVFRPTVPDGGSPCPSSV